MKAYDEFGGYDSPLFDTDAAGGQGRGSGDNDRKCLCRKRECDSPSPAGKFAKILRTTRIMFSKGMVSKSKYWISEKNKGMSVSICLHFKGIFQSQYSLF